MIETPKELLSWAKSEGVEYVDIRFTDMLGTTHHFTMPLHAIGEEDFEHGIGFDGSSIRGWKAINESDMLAMMDPTTAFIDPFFQHKTMGILCDIYEPKTMQPYNRDPRFILKKALEEMKNSGIADTCYLGPEAEFFIFRDVRFNSNMKEAFYHIDSDDASWNMGSTDIDGGVNLGHKLRDKGGYFPTPPADLFQDLRSEMLRNLDKVGIPAEKHHHEVASAGQAEINIKVSSALKMADQMVLYKYIVKNTAHRHGYSATFMPKPVYNDNGTGMHTHQSLWKDGKNLFAGTGYGNLSEMALHYVGGILEHGPSILAFSNPTTNSYKRLVPGFEAPVNLVYSARNRSASIRIPVAVHGDKARRIEFRTADASSCPYLAFAAMIMAGIDGIKNKTNPGEPADFNLYEATPEQQANMKRVPANLTKVLDALEENNTFLKPAFDEDFIENYVEYKRAEVEEVVNKRPHPYEFVLYYDC